MRKSQKFSIGYNEDNIPYGIALHADYVAQHEYGIDGILNFLHIPIKGKDFTYHNGFETRSQKHPANPNVFQFKYYKKSELKISRNNKNKPNKMSMLIIGNTLENSEMQRYTTITENRNEHADSFWDSRSALIIGYNETANILEEIYSAGLKGNLSIYTGNGVETKNPFGKTALIIAVTDRVPKSIINEAQQSDSEIKKLEEDADATGIRQLIKEKIGESSLYKGPGAFFELKPARIIRSKGDHKEIVSQYPVIFFLNPKNKNKYNYGWFTVEDLMLWLEDKGPVIKTN